ncbi:ubiquinone biosynthesis accessory factor UbiJ [Gallaecimonas pentaromativorans]|uniref:Ubiquinone biosynthesis accessory factor UbiJ n=1 Tax=Gallaecimonas pentaromativorans TaxID=584787 RepID=A0A3N1PBI7_9GAMM|nr:SCP2 sterol-binding domain-containing protein [Gallaecimonas pentaromativorans]ROQ24367.1 ubiquinone biosynthesis protein UbiJ [Gallaecimonas pentaromativorans]
MPFKQLIQALAQTGANRLLALDDSSGRRLGRLSGKTVLVQLTDINLGLGFVVLDDGLLVTGDLAAPDAKVALPVAAIKELKDSANLPRAIKEGRLELTGDPMLLKQFSELFAKLDIDWEGELAKYLGDVPAHLLFSATARLSRRLAGSAGRFAQWGAEQLTEESRLTPNALEQRQFFDDVDDLKSALARLERRLAALEHR